MAARQVAVATREAQVAVAYVAGRVVALEAMAIVADQREGQEVKAVTVAHEAAADLHSIRLLAQLERRGTAEAHGFPHNLWHYSKRHCAHSPSSCTSSESSTGTLLDRRGTRSSPSLP